MRVLVTGASGQLGAYLLELLSRTPYQITAWSGRQACTRAGVRCESVDLTAHDAMQRAFTVARPQVVIHAAAISSIAQCFRDPDRALKVNVQATATLAELTTRSNARLVYISTDLVFDGVKGSYRESDETSPLSVYGRTKAQGEVAVLNNPDSAVVRLSLLYGPARIGRPAFFDEQLTSLSNGTPIRLFVDEWRTPLGLATAAQALISVAAANFSGILHVGGPERISRYEMGLRVARYFGFDSASIIPSKRSDVFSDESRPCDCSLDCGLCQRVLPELERPTIETELRLLYPDNAFSGRGP